LDSNVPEFLVLDVMPAEVSGSPGGNSATKNIFYENIKMLFLCRIKVTMFQKLKKFHCCNEVANHMPLLQIEAICYRTQWMQNKIRKTISFAAPEGILSLC
jgi:hypothetical protein